MDISRIQETHNDETTYYGYQEYCVKFRPEEETGGILTSNEKGRGGVSILYRNQSVAKIKEIVKTPNMITHIAIESGRAGKNPDPPYVCAANGVR